MSETIDLKVKKGSWVVIVEPGMEVSMIAPDGCDGEQVTGESLLALAMAEIITNHPDWVERAADELLTKCNAMELEEKPE